MQAKFHLNLCLLALTMATYSVLRAEEPPSNELQWNMPKINLGGIPLRNLKISSVTPMVEANPKAQPHAGQDFYEIKIERPAADEPQKFSSPLVISKDALERIMTHLKAQTVDALAGKNFETDYPESLNEVYAIDGLYMDATHEGHFIRPSETEIYDEMVDSIVNQKQPDFKDVDFYSLDQALTNAFHGGATFGDQLAKNVEKKSSGKLEIKLLSTPELQALPTKIDIADQAQYFSVSSKGSKTPQGVFMVSPQADGFKFTSLSGSTSEPKLGRGIAVQEKEEVVSEDLPDLAALVRKGYSRLEPSVAIQDISETFDGYEKYLKTHRTEYPYQIRDKILARQIYLKEFRSNQISDLKAAQKLQKRGDELMKEVYKIEKEISKSQAKLAAKQDKENRARLEKEEKMRKEAERKARKDAEKAEKERLKALQGPKLFQSIDEAKAGERMMRKPSSAGSERTQSPSANSELTNDYRRSVAGEPDRPALPLVPDAEDAN